MPVHAPPEPAPAAVTPFRQRVYDALRRVPAGQVCTYGSLARAIGCRCPRAVGQALRHNPFAPAVPCHRVLATDLTLGGFRGHRVGAATQHKRALLAAEGVRFDPAGRLLDPARQHCFPAAPPGELRATPSCPAPRNRSRLDVPR